MKKTLLLIPLIFLSVSLVNINAQETYTVFGVRAGFGLSNLDGMGPYRNTGRLPGTNIFTKDQYKTSVYPAWDIGVSMQHVKDKVMIQCDFILASYLNTRLKNAYVDEKKLSKIRLFYNNINVVGGTKIPINENFRYVLGIGPYIGFDMTGWFSDRDRRYGKRGDGSTFLFGGTLEAEEADYREFDFGGIIMTGIEIKNIQLALTYQHGFTNVVKDDFSLYNRVYKIAMTYFF